MTNQELDPYDIIKETARRDAEIEVAKAELITAPLIKKMNKINTSTTIISIIAILIALAALGVSIISYYK